jgi:hypothetical protein
MTTETTTTTKRTYKRFDPTATEQECRRCGKTKPMSAYYPAPYVRADGVRPMKAICKNCMIKRVTDRQSNTPTKIKLDGEPDEGLVASYKARQARQKAADRKREREAAERAAMRPQKLWQNPNLGLSL